eukprot:scaffold73649_cov62-Phaeocystis_antarctica.AAC.9
MAGDDEEMAGGVGDEEAGGAAARWALRPQGLGFALALRPGSQGQLGAFPEQARLSSYSTLVSMVVSMAGRLPQAKARHHACYGQEPNWRWLQAACEEAAAAQGAPPLLTLLTLLALVTLLTPLTPPTLLTRCASARAQPIRLLGRLDAGVCGGGRLRGASRRGEGCGRTGAPQRTPLGSGGGGCALAV